MGNELIKTFRSNLNFLFWKESFVKSEWFFCWEKLILIGQSSNLYKNVFFWQTQKCVWVECVVGIFVRFVGSRWCGKTACSMWRPMLLPAELMELRTDSGRYNLYILSMPRKKSSPKATISRDNPYLRCTAPQIKLSTIPWLRKALGVKHQLSDTLLVFFKVKTTMIYRSPTLLTTLAKTASPPTRKNISYTLRYSPLAKTATFDPVCV